MPPVREMTAADLALRPATPEDAAFAADMYTELQPEDPEDPALWQHWWANVDPSATVERYIAMRDGQPAGLAGIQHPSWDKMPERYARVIGEAVKPLRTAERVGALLAFSEGLARRDGALHATTWSWEWDGPRILWLSDRGYKEERRERFWELDLVANRARLEEMARASRRRMKEQGIQVRTVADDPDPEKYRKIWEVSEEASRDIPTTVPHVETPFEVFRKWFQSPGIREDRMWIARIGQEIVGISALAYPPVRGVVTTDWTGTARSVRGKGVARAIKCETVMQAIALGVDRVRTDNDFKNKPILHINESMGYQPRPEMIQFIKDLRVT